MIAWHIPDFEDSCPLPVRSSGAPNKKRRRGHRGGRRGGNANGDPDQAQTVHAAAQAAESSEPAIESERDFNA